MRGRRRDERIGNAEGDARNVSRIEMIRVSPSSWLDYYFDSISSVGLIYRELNGDIRPTFFLSIDSRPTIRKISSARRSSASDLDSASRCGGVGRVDGIFRVELERLIIGQTPDRIAEAKKNVRTNDLTVSRRVTDHSG